MADRRTFVTTPFPLAGDVVAHITIPHDLTPAEAERMGKALMFLAIPESTTTELPGRENPYD